MNKYEYDEKRVMRVGAALGVALIIWFGVVIWALISLVQWVTSK